ncbi:MAG TPA: hypothetical protein VGW35_04190 [Methylomirabilota bacterium]|nr:hypothetical protein [Methylomirabilota bacterium]
MSVAAEARGDHLVSITAAGAPLRAVLAELARRAGFEVSEVTPVGRTVSVQFKRLPLDRALEQLLRGENFVLVYGRPAEGGPDRLRRVILLGSAIRGAGARSAEEPQASAPDLPAGLPTAEGDEESAPMLPDGAELFDPDGPIEQILALTAHRDPRMRTAALEALTLHAADERARQALMQHITDPDADVRSVVVGLLGAFLTEWPGAEDVVMGALRDPAASVRHLAIHTLWESSTPRAAEAIQLALQDEDPKIRAFAQELLRQRTEETPSEVEPDQEIVAEPETS